MKKNNINTNLIDVDALDIIAPIIFTLCMFSCIALAVCMLHENSAITERLWDQSNAMTFDDCIQDYNNIADESFFGDPYTTKQRDKMCLEVINRNKIKYDTVTEYGLI